MSTQASKGAALLDAGKYSEAIEQYTLALAQNPNAPDYYIKRSTAYQRKSPPDYAAALQDAEYGVVAATARSRRELMAQAQLRRAIALFHLGRYKDAEFILGVVAGLDEKEKSLSLWQAKVSHKLSNLTGQEPPEATADNVAINPRVSLPEMLSSGSVSTNKPSSVSESTGSRVSEKQIQQVTIQQTPVDKIKHDWYQSHDKVYLSIMAKGVPKDQADIDILDNSVFISFPTTDDKTYSFSLDPLFAKIDPSQSIFTITNHKIEVVLKKLEVSNWSKLESDGQKSRGGPEESVKTATELKGKLSKTEVGESKSEKTEATGPSYPTSSRSGPKNWDKLANDIGDDNEGEDDVNQFFKHLYKGADPDTQRAMLKSYQESNGTVLSTNWSEVGAGKVETAPPEGMVAKKFDS